MNIIRPLSKALFVAVAVLGTGHTAVGGLPYNRAALTGLDELGVPVIKIFDPEDPDCWFEALLKGIPSGEPSSVKVRYNVDGVLEYLVTFNSGNAVKVPFDDFIVQCPEKKQAGMRPRSGPSPSPTPIVIQTSNDADSLAVSCDGRFAVVVGSTFFSQT